MRAEPLGPAFSWLGIPVALGLLVLLLAPSTVWYDSGELAAAAAHLGVPHPTGFPLFNLSGHLFTLLPIGPLALRIHLVGATAGVMAVWLWLNCLNSGEGPFSSQPLWVVGACAAAAIALPLLGPAPLQHVRAAEVYPLTWLVVVVALVIWQRDRRGQQLPALLVMCGLATLIHVEAVLICGSLTGLSVLELLRRRALSTRMLLVGGLACLLAVAGLAYLPLAAWRMPALNWGDVRSPEGLWRHLSAASIRQAYADHMGAPALTDTLAVLADQTRRHVGWLALPAGLGAVLAWRRQRRALLATGLVIGIDVAYSLFLNPMGLRDSQVGLLLFIGSLVLAVRGLLGAAALAGAAGAGARRALRTLVPILLIVLAGQAAATALAHSPRVDLEAGGRMADRLFRDVPARALLVTSSDHASAACVWLQAAEGVRPDSPCIPGVFTRDWRMLDLLAIQTGEQGFADVARVVEAGGSTRAGLAAWLRPIADKRPLRWELGLAAEERFLGAHLLAGFPWQSVTPRPSDHKAQAHAATAALEAMVDHCREAPPRSCRPGAPLSTWLAHHANVLAARLMAAGRPAAGPLLMAATQWAPDDPKVLNNLAVFLIGRGQPAAALAACERALASQRDYHRAHRTAARASLLLGRSQQALGHARAYIMSGQLSEEKRRWLDGLSRLTADRALGTRLRGLLPEPPPTTRPEPGGLKPRGPQ